jgi:hypothetical protein
MGFEDFVRDVIMKNKVKKVNLGRLPSSISKDFRTFIEDRNYLEDQIDIRKRQLTLEIEQKLRDEFDTRLDAMQFRQESEWDKVYQEMNIDPNGDYKYNRETNEIYMFVTDEESFSNSNYR